MGKRELARRIKTALVMSLVALCALVLGGWWLAAPLIVLGVLLLREWDQLTHKFGAMWRLSGVLYVALPLLSLGYLRYLEIPGGDSFTAIYACIVPICMVIATDIGGMLFGKTLGGPKLAPTLSPNKTWSGLLGAMGLSMVVSWLWLPLTPWVSSVPSALLIGAVVAVIAQLGDLFESSLKRRAGVKDSGTILPGHGGLLDRFDGYVLVLPSYLAFIIL